MTREAPACDEGSKRTKGLRVWLESAVTRKAPARGGGSRSRGLREW